LPPGERCRGVIGSIIFMAQRGRFVVLLIVLIGIVLAAPGTTTAGEQPRRVFFLKSLNPTHPAAVRTIDSFKRRLSEKSSARIELFFDALELTRIPGEAHELRSAHFLGEKYAQMTT
jgi:hypothetical protein